MESPEHLHEESTLTLASQGTEYRSVSTVGDDDDDEVFIYERKKLRHSPSSHAEPFHTSFTLFQKLPLELRQIIWELSLESRVVEVEFSETRGFFTRVPIPVALRVCRDSRHAVGAAYPVSFGNILYQPRILFNFSLDTLYFDQAIQNQFLHFLATMKTEEVKKISFVAIDSDIEFDEEHWGDAYIDCFKALCNVAPSLPALKEALLVQFIPHASQDDIPIGNGTMQLFEEWPHEVWSYHWCDPDDEFFGFPDYVCDEHVLEEPHQLSGLKDLRRVKTRSVWGWRATKD